MESLRIVPPPMDSVTADGTVPAFSNQSILYLYFKLIVSAVHLILNRKISNITAYFLFSPCDITLSTSSSISIKEIEKHCYENIQPKMLLFSHGDELL